MSTVTMREVILNNFISLPIRKQLLILIFILMLPVIILMVRSEVDQRNDDIAAALASTRELANAVANEKVQLVAGSQQLALALSQLPEVQNPDSKKLTPLLARILRLNPQYVNILVTNRNGLVWASALPMKKSLSMADRHFFKKAKVTQKFSSGEFVVGKLSKKPMMTFAHPLNDRNGIFNGVISVSFDLEYFRRLPPLMQFPSGTSILLLDHQGVILARTLENSRFAGTRFSPQIFRKMISLPDGSSFRSIGVDNVERFSSHRKLWLQEEPRPYMYVRVGIPVAAVVREADMELARTSAIAVIVIAAAYFMTWITGKCSIADRVDALEAACRRVADGDLKARVSDAVSGGDLGRLARMFDVMADQLAKREEALLTLQDMLQGLNDRLQTGCEEERRNIAREIHDVMGQSLTALKLDISWLVQQVATTCPDVVKRYEEIVSLIDSLIAEVQTITAQLSPPLLDIGLAAAIEWHCSEFERRSGITCHMMVDETCSASREEETMLFRILQEALSNVLRHSGASEVSVSLCARQNSLILEVADNGKGITEEAGNSPAAFGLLGMNERARMYEAILSITGAPGKGTIVRTELPLNGRKGESHEKNPCSG